MEMDHIRSFDARPKEGCVVPALHDGTVPADSDSIQDRIRGELITRQCALRRGHDDLVTFPNQITGDAEDLGLPSPSCVTEEWHSTLGTLGHPPSTGAR